MKQPTRQAVFLGARNIAGRTIWSTTHCWRSTPLRDIQMPSTKASLNFWNCVEICRASSRSMQD